MELSSQEILLTVSNLTKHYQKEKKTNGITNVSFKIDKGEIFGIAGESGAGKSTLGKIIAGWETKDSGKIEFKGKEIQYLCQDPYSAVNPKQSITQIIEEPWIIRKKGTKKQRLEKVKEVLFLVGLDERFMMRYPNQLSGGQLQRVIIARSLMLNPDLFIADEITSSLDVTVQKQIMKLIWRLNKERQMTCLLISHDLELLRHMCKNIAILSKGIFVECGSPNKLWEQPEHKETKELLQSILKFKISQL